MLEEYFDFQRPDDIRFKGSRIGIESVLYEYIHRAQSPEAIQQMFPSLSLEQVYADNSFTPCETKRQLTIIWQTGWNSDGRREKRSRMTRFRQWRVFGK